MCPRLGHYCIYRNYVIILSSYLLGMITIIYSLTGTVAHYPCVTGDRGDESSVESHHHNPIDEWLIVLGLVFDGGGLYGD